MWTFSIRERGFKGYFKHYFEPVPWMFPLEVLQDLLKPVTLALRLFGNIFAGGIMLALIAGMVSLAPAHIPLGSRPDHRVRASSGSSSTRCSSVVSRPSSSRC